MQAIEAVATPGETAAQCEAGRTQNRVYPRHRELVRLGAISGNEGKAPAGPRRWRSGGV